MQVRQLFIISFLLLGALAQLPVQAEQMVQTVASEEIEVKINQAPRDAVVATVNGLVERLKVEQSPANGAYLHQVVEEQLLPFVDFKRITRLVMDKYFKSATTEQRNQFLETFQQSLVSTYASGLGKYDGRQRIEVLPTEVGDVKGRRAKVRVILITADGKEYPLVYSMYQNKSGEWKLENLVINGINLGKTFRTQFDQLMKQYQDVDMVIAQWKGGLDTP